MVEGEPGLLISPACKMIRKGFTGGCHYRRVQVVGDERFTDKPDKNRFSHPHDALQYLLSGGGEGLAILGRKKRARHFVNPSRADWSDFHPHTW